MFYNTGGSNSSGSHQTTPNRKWSDLDDDDTPNSKSSSSSPRDNFMMFSSSMLTVPQYESMVESYNNNSALLQEDSYSFGDARENCDDLNVQMLMAMDSDDIITFSNNQYNHRLILDCISKNIELCIKLYEQIVSGNLLQRLATHCYGNFIVRKLIDTIQIILAEEPGVLEAFYTKIEDECIVLLSNHYGCHVLQNYISTVPEGRVSRILQNICAARSEEKAMTDQYASHVTQAIFSKFKPETYFKFIRAIVCNNAAFKRIIQNKFGCRSVQKCLESLVIHASNTSHRTRTDSKDAYTLLSMLIPPIINNAINYAENEFANYIIQYIFRTNFLQQPRRQIIEEHILKNILWFSQHKFASHVVEHALIYADPDQLEAMFNEILYGYHPDKHKRNALDIMLFDQYANYVVQSLIRIAIDVCLGKRSGEPTWLTDLAMSIYANRMKLMRYSSGKRILDQMEEARKLLPPHFYYTGHHHHAIVNMPTETFYSYY